MILTVLAMMLHQDMAGKPVATPMAEAASAASSNGRDCDDAMTQSEMNICSYRQYEAADAELNSAWRGARDVAKATNRFSSLLDAQRAWLSFRDAHCTAVGARYAGGSILPLIHNNCMTELTRQRTAQLYEMSETH